MKDPITWAENKKKHRRQRAKRGFSVYDWWNFDTYLSWVMINALEKFRDDGVGHPANLTENEWTTILNVMIDGFEALILLETEEDEELLRRGEIALDLFRIYYRDLWD